MWIYGSGFPKSMNIGIEMDKRNGVESDVVGFNRSGVSSRAFQSEEKTTAGEYEIKKAKNKWQGWGTALKPSFEPIIVARKPFKGSLVDNVIEYGVGGINIDECRVGTNEDIKVHNYTQNSGIYGKYNNEIEEHSTNQGRFPANTILTYDETDFDEVCGGFPITKQNGSIKNPNLKNSLGNGGIYNKYSENQPIWEAYQDSGSASRYFYCAKASKKDRDEGLDGFENGNITDGRKAISDRPYLRKETPRKNIHPTVKPTSLMQYLVRLVTPKGGIILDPFMGSGSTGKAVMFENQERQANYSFIGIEKEKEYCDIAKARIEWAKNYKDKKGEDNQIHIDELGGLTNER